MSPRKVPESIKKRLKKHHQEHLLTFWEQLGPDQQQDLLRQIEDLDFLKTDACVEDFIKKAASASIPADFTAAPFYSNSPCGAEQQQKYAEAIKLGKQLISSGKVAAFVVAGGQGTRLGLDGPKGNFPISPVKNKTLFQIFAETILAVSKKYNAVCPWYIMTSPLNHSETVEIFKKNNYYGLNPDDIFIFQQGTFANFSFDGKILLADKDKISVSPDGHGGSLKALHRSGALKDMKKRGVEFVSYFQIDNPLITIFDPLFIGLHALDNSQISSRAVIKAGPEEKVGSFCIADGKIMVIEYSDLPTKLACRRNPDNSLVFGLASIAIHIINLDFIEQLNAKGLSELKASMFSKRHREPSHPASVSLPLHKAVKKIPHLDCHDNFIVPTEPNGIKLESFIFDALPLASRSIILQTLRGEEFSPVKNAAGSDSAQTAKEMMICRAARWLESAGVSIPRKPDGSIDCVIEIAPSFALDIDDVKAKRNEIGKIAAGDKVYLS